jgi:signal transduction histidine kinase
MKLIIYFLIFQFSHCGFLSYSFADYNLTKSLRCGLESSSDHSLSEELVKPIEKKEKISEGPESLNFSFDKNSYICKLQAIEPLSKEYDLLVVGASNQDYIDLLIQNSSGANSYYELGDRRSFHPSLLTDYPYTIPWESASGLVIRLKTHDGLHDPITLKLVKSKEYWSKVKIDTTIESIFLGAILSQIVYNLLIYFGVKDLSYLFFILYQVSIFMWFAGYYGKFSKTIYSSFLGNQMLALASCGIVFSFAQFSIQFLDIKKKLIKRINFSFIGVLSFVIILIFLNYYSLSYLIILLIEVIAIVGIIPVLIYLSYIQNKRITHIYWIAFSPMLFGALLLIFKMFGVLPHNLFTENAYLLGTILQNILFSYSLSIKFQDTMKENVEFQKEMRERTELHSQEIKQESDRAKKAYLELEASQKQLVLSDKMITLGTMVAGIVHEINTPLGAIKANSENISENMKSLIQKLDPSSTYLTPEILESTYHLIQLSKDSISAVSTREQRQLKKKILSLLEEMQLPNSDTVVDSILELGLVDALESRVPIFLSPHLEKSLALTLDVLSVNKKSKVITTSSERVSKIVKSLKSFMHFQHSEEMVMADIPETMETVLTILHSKIKQGITVTTIYADIPKVYCYPDELSQIFTNLIHNSIQAMEEKGELKIAVQLSPIPQPGSISSPFPESKEEKKEFLEKYMYDKFLSISIEDSGPGIPIEIQKKIFEPFFTTKKAGEGSGLGLHIIQKILEKHNGYLEFYTIPGCTRFTVNIPARI